MAWLRREATNGVSDVAGFRSALGHLMREAFLGSFTHVHLGTASIGDQTSTSLCENRLVTFGRPHIAEETLSADDELESASPSAIFISTSCAAASMSSSAGGGSYSE